MGRKKLFDIEKRRLIQKLLQDGARQIEIAKALGCAKTTVNREVMMNGGVEFYDAEKAQIRADTGSLPPINIEERLSRLERFIRNTFTKSLRSKNAKDK